MGLNFFNIELICSNCGKTLKSGDEIVAHITLPSEKKMPVGRMDRVLSKHSDKVYCKKCSE
ncbi:hypothetical protein KY998_04765 [Bacillus paralicheniformis]|jgi:hypothetical protein|uniref:C2H2-type domain-containing protein n=2 Tax=Bacillus TaxID=1386 RepID=A0A0T6BV43_9BACI|nr:MULTISPECIES: hypothetical protein [Bacillus]AMR10688.1 hypothetical protein AB684_11015 [Bacillus licheniformis]ARC67956.1 hypothetical protein B34_00513 [Bacillus licheniformis]KJH58786.1 hypothetical protein UF14_10325 [Bacillus licheniformis]KND05552.1 hypothetical protein ACJ43_20555 [Bacillus paralicheniformis]KRT95508.1 hypothetical protein AB447_209410 [Bacillus glycinifermentans]